MSFKCHLKGHHKHICHQFLISRHTHTLTPIKTIACFPASPSYHHQLVVHFLRHSV